MKKNYPIPDGLAQSANIVSATGFTGLMPSTPEDEAEQQNYTDIYKLPQEETQIISK